MGNRLLAKRECDRIQALRAAQYAAHGLVSAAEAGALVRDAYHSNSRHFGAYTGDGRLIGSSRLVLPGAVGLFALDGFGVNARGRRALEQTSLGRYAEASALAVERSFGRLFIVSAGLYRAMIQDAIEQLEARVLLAVIDRALRRILERQLHMPLRSYSFFVAAMRRRIPSGFRP